MGGVLVGGRLGPSDHEMIEFLIVREVRRVSAQLLLWASGGMTLIYLGDWLTESLGKS